MFALGIGLSVDSSELEQIASSPENVITIDSFEDLTDKIKDFRDGFCKGRLHTCLVFVSNLLLTLKNYTCTAFHLFNKSELF